MTPVEALAMGTAMIACWDRLPKDPDAHVSVTVFRRISNDESGAYSATAVWNKPSSPYLKVEVGYGDGETTSLIALASALAAREKKEAPAVAAAGAS